MKLQFNHDFDYQQQAIASVVDLFLGQTPILRNAGIDEIVSV